MDTTNKYAGWIQLAMAAVAAFIQVWNAVQGGHVDATGTVVTGGLLAGGLAHITKR